MSGATGRWVGLLILLGIVFTSIGLGLSLCRVLDQPEPPSPPVQATVIRVLDDPTWTTTRTLVEYEDGTRAVLSNYYGEAGDTFMLRQKKQP